MPRSRQNFASATLRVWARLDYLRHALSFAAWMMALTALSLLAAGDAAQRAAPG